MANPMRKKAINGLKTNDEFTYTRKFTEAETLASILKKLN